MYTRGGDAQKPQKSVSQREKYKKTILGLGFRVWLVALLDASDDFDWTVSQSSQL